LCGVCHSFKRPERASLSERQMLRKHDSDHVPNGSVTPELDADEGTLALALAGIDEVHMSKESLRCASAALEHPRVGWREAEGVLRKLATWLAAPKAQASVASSSLPDAVVLAMRKFCSEPPVVALACVVVTRACGDAATAAAHVRAGAIEEVSGLMDRHPSHGGMQNVCLLLLGELLKDASVARKAVSLGAVDRVLVAMDATTGREVQYNGCAVLQHLAGPGRAPRAGLQETAMRAKAAHPGDLELCNLADDLLAVVTPRFKEVMCWHWQSGWCRLGPRCTYAHGVDDLRSS